MYMYNVLEGAARSHALLHVLMTGKTKCNVLLYLLDIIRTFTKCKDIGQPLIPINILQQIQIIYAYNCYIIQANPNTIDHICYMYTAKYI